MKLFDLVNLDFSVYSLVQPEKPILMMDSSGPSLSCSRCEIDSFPTLLSQRQHFKTPEHLKNILNTDSSDSESEEEVTVGSPHIHVSVEQQEYKVWKNILFNRKSELYSNFTEEEAIMRLKNISKEKFWFLILCRGGRFACAIFDNQSGKMTKHKCFHRYVVRKGQGGLQSSKDKEGKKIKSAGSSLRRHNEKEFKNDVKRLFQSWKEEIEICSRIFLNNSSTKDSIFFEDGMLNKETVRTFPFTTKTPNIESLEYCYKQLVELNLQ